MSLEPQKESQKEDIELELQLGDIIQITNPVNENLNNQTFALHFDANKFAAYLSKIANQRGVKHIVDNYKYKDKTKDPKI